MGTAQSSDELLHQLLVTEDNIEPLLDSLQSKGLVARFNSDGMLSITETGKRLLVKLDGPVMDLHCRQLSHLPEGDLAELNRLLIKARESASQMCQIKNPTIFRSSGIGYGQVRFCPYQ